MNPRRLSRSHNRQLAGVAGGMAEYLDLDPTVVRILWVIVGIASGGLAILAYIILALVMPQASSAPASGGWAAASTGTGATAGWGTPPPAPGWAPGWDAGASAAPQSRPRTESRGLGAAAIIGVVLIVVGAIALADAALPGSIAAAILGPAVLLTLGAALLVSSLRRREDDAPARNPPSRPRRLRRHRRHPGRLPPRPRGRSPRPSRLTRQSSARRWWRRRTRPPTKGRTPADRRRAARTAHDPLPVPASFRDGELPARVGLASGSARSRRPGCGPRVKASRVRRSGCPVEASGPRVEGHQAAPPLARPPTGPTLAPMPAEIEDAGSDPHDAKPDGWFVGRPFDHERLRPGAVTPSTLRSAQGSACARVSGPQ